MSFKLITFVQNADWVRIWATVGTISTFWIGLTALALVWPVFDVWYKVINIILGAAVNAALYAARAGKYVENRTEPPPQDGRP
jgi:hypothetical protein